MSIIKGDSLLSNISNVSVLIGNKPSDGSEIFNFSRVNGFDEGQQRDLSEYNRDKEYEVKLDDISNDEYVFRDENSLIVKKEVKADSGYNSHTVPIVPQFTYHSGNWAKEEEGISQEDSVSEEQNVEDQAMLKKIKNETKNIPKNYGKAIISFIERYKEIVMRICELNRVPYDDFTLQLMQIKKTINTIADLRNLWINYKYAKCMRIVSNLFLRKYSFNYIFNSRICNFKSHVKYRYRLCEAIKDPKAFKHIKDY